MEQTDRDRVQRALDAATFNEVGDYAYWFGYLRMAWGQLKAHVEKLEADRG